MGVTKDTVKPGEYISDHQRSASVYGCGLARSPLVINKHSGLMKFCLSNVTAVTQRQVPVGLLTFQIVEGCPL
jgi:hypothetical protein